LLVVIAIIAVLVGLLLPAVQKVRESAARTKCQNNLKQVVLGSHLYQDTNQKLPPGWLTSADGSVAPNPGWTWGAMILPYIEQKNLYDLLGITTNPPNAATSNTNTTSKVVIYRCPSDPSADINSHFGGNYGFSNYVCNKEVVGPGRADGGNVADGLSIQTIRDGASNTILFGERDGVNGLGANWGVRGSTTASFEGRPGYGLNPKLPAGKNQWTTNDNERLAYSSLHTNGVNFAMGDGRVIFLTDSIDADTTDTHGNFPACMSNATTNACQGGSVGMQSNFTLQKMQHPNDKLPVSIP
jgi:type II secretory pathway pseudopilin PulG